VLTGVSVSATRIGDLEGEEDDQVVFQDFGRNWRTDDRGIYRIYGLIPGSYVVQAGGRSGGPGPTPLSPFSADAPTYYPSSSRDAATPVVVRAGEEVSGIDINYRGEKGHVVSGRVIAKAGEEGGGFSQTQITLSLAGSDAIVATAMQMDRGPMNRGPGNRGPANRGQANQGFAFYGISDGEYEIVARRGGFGVENDSVSAPRRVTVRAADVGGVELTLSPLASVNGHVVLEKPAALCEKKRSSVIEEVLMSAEHEQTQARETASVGRLAARRPSAPTLTGEFTLHNLTPGRHRLITQLPDDNWYVRAIVAQTKVEAKPSAPAARRAASPPPTNIARNGVTLKPGEKLTGVTVTITEGAAGMKGQVTPAQEGKSLGKTQVYVIPAEKESADDLLRYAQAQAGGSGDFQFKHLAPGRYYLLAKPIKEDAQGKSSGRLQAFDNAQRAILRKEAEAAGRVVELQPCQRMTEYKFASSN
jgi:hypothetical protein